MKKYLFGVTIIIALACVTAVMSAFAPPPPTTTYGAKYFNANTPYASAWDTVVDAVNDTVAATIPGVKTSVAFSLESDEYGSGDNSGVTFKLYVHAGTTIDYKSTPIFSVTSPNGDTTINYAFTGNPYTTYTWIVDGAGTQTSRHRITMNIR